MNRKCSTRIICPGPAPGLFGDSPVSNYTAELPDTLNFAGFSFPIFDTNNPLGGGTNTTGGFPPWLVSDCEGSCISSFSQDDANACAARQAFICAHTPPTGTPPQFFFNQSQSASFVCSDGSLYTYTVLPGYFVALSLAEANQLAFNLALQRAITNHVCLGTLSPNMATVGQFYAATVTLSGTFPLGASMVSGSLPPGLLLSQDPAGQTFSISGTPTGSGTFNFGIMATDPNGNFNIKTYTISVPSVCGPSIPWLTNPGTCRVKIQGYFDGIFVNSNAGLCTSTTPGSGKVWDGTFTNIVNLPSYASDSSFGQVSGLRLVAGVNNTDIRIFGGQFLLEVKFISDFTSPVLWLGTKADTSTPLGTYNQTGGCSPVPASLTVIGYQS